MFSKNESSNTALEIENANKRYENALSASIKGNGAIFLKRETKDVFMVRVKDRTRPTLYREIHKHIREGTTIISDEWRAYCTLEDEGYQHRTICHKRNFVSPDDPTVHTQNIESQWRQAKNCFPKNSTTEDLRESYLQEYMYRKKYGKNNMVHKLIEDIKLVYPYNR